MEPCRHGCDTTASDTTCSDQHAPDVVEIPLLLPSWQVMALESAAHNAGLTAGEMVRHLLREFIARLPGQDKSLRRSEFPTGS
jgi:hypothetical protein